MIDRIKQLWQWFFRPPPAPADRDAAIGALRGHVVEEWRKQGRCRCGRQLYHYNEDGCTLEHCAFERPPHNQTF